MAPSCVTSAPQPMTPSNGSKLANKISEDPNINFYQKGAKNKKFGAWCGWRQQNSPFFAIRTACAEIQPPLAHSSALSGLRTRCALALNPPSSVVSLSQRFHSLARSARRHVPAGQPWAHSTFVFDGSCLRGRGVEDWSLRLLLKLNCVCSVC
jgi:hypothetical protein